MLRAIKGIFSPTSRMRPRSRFIRFRGQKSSRSMRRGKVTTMGFAMRAPRKQRVTKA